jgi:hypothetical protein
MFDILEKAFIIGHTHSSHFACGQRHLFPIPGLVLGHNEDMLGTSVEPVVV